LAFAVHLATQTEALQQIRSIHLRSQENILGQLERDLLQYADEQKVKDWLTEVAENPENRNRLMGILAKMIGK